METANQTTAAAGAAALPAPTWLLPGGATALARRAGAAVALTRAVQHEGTGASWFGRGREAEQADRLEEAAYAYRECVKRVRLANICLTAGRHGFSCEKKPSSVAGR